MKFLRVGSETSYYNWLTKALTFSETIALIAFTFPLALIYHLKFINASQQYQQK